jgi:hypothetical protein
MSSNFDYNLTVKDLNTEGLSNAKIIFYQTLIGDNLKRAMKALLRMLLTTKIIILLFMFNSNSFPILRG